MGRTLENGRPRPGRKELAIRLGAVQREVADLKIPSVVIIEGLDGSGKGLLLHKLILEIDARAYGDIDEQALVIGNSISAAWFGRHNRH